MLSFTTREATSRQDVDDITDLTWASHYNPYRPFVGLNLTVFGPTKEDRDAGVVASKQRYWDRHSANPASHWIMVHEKLTGKLVGASEWLINEKNPFPNGVPKIIATWWPEGVGRDFCSEMLNQAYLPRTSWMRRPSIGRVTCFQLSMLFVSNLPLLLVLNIMSTHPDYRRRGIGALMMEFGEQKAKELHLECWTEASESGRFLYEKFGYKVLIKYSLNAQKAVMSDEWRRLAHEHMPQEVYAMWKPEGGIFTDDTVLPWDRGAASS